MLAFVPSLCVIIAILVSTAATITSRNTSQATASSIIITHTTNYMTTTSINNSTMDPTILIPFNISSCNNTVLIPMSDGTCQSIDKASVRHQKFEYIYFFLIFTIVIE